MPMLIGMLPSLGGAYFSAPMVKEATSGIHMSQEEKAFINYWFRHPWEYHSPPLSRHIAGLSCIEHPSLQPH